MRANPEDVKIATAWFTEHALWLRRRAVKAVGPKDAEDCIQSLFLNIVRRGRLAEISDPEKYLTSAQSRMFAGHWRSRSRAEVLVADAKWEDPSETSDAGERLERMDDIAFIQRCLPLLKARHRAVLEHQMSGMTRAEIAAELRVSPHAVTQLTRRALDALDHKLKQNGYVRGLVPVPLLTWFRTRVRSCAEFLDRYGRPVDALLSVAVVAAASILPAGLDQDRDLLERNPATVARPESAAGAGAAPRRLPVTSKLSLTRETEDRRTSPLPNRTRTVLFEQGQTKAGVDEWGEEKEEPPLDRQVRDIVSDPGRTFPACPETIPCPWEDP